MLIVKSKVREHIKKLGDYKVGGDFIDALDKKMEKLIKSAVERTKANGRKTVSARDV